MANAALRQWGLRLAALGLLVLAGGCNYDYAVFLNRGYEEADVISDGSLAGVWAPQEGGNRFLLVYDGGGAYRMCDRPAPNGGCDPRRTMNLTLFRLDGRRLLDMTSTDVFKGMQDSALLTLLPVHAFALVQAGERGISLRWLKSLEVDERLEEGDGPAFVRTRLAEDLECYVVTAGTQGVRDFLRTAIEEDLFTAPRRYVQVTGFGPE